MARELRDVLHYFLDDEAEPRRSAEDESGGTWGDGGRARRAPDPAAEGPGPGVPFAAGRLPILACPLHGRDALRLALVWNLAAELERLGRGPRFVAARPPVETGSDLEACDSFPMTWIEPIQGELAPLTRAALALSRTPEDASVPSDRAPGALVLAPIPTDLSWSREDAPVLGRCWLAVGPSDRERGGFLSLCERILGLRPDAEVGLTVVGAADLRGARRTFASLAEIFACRFDRPLRSHGLVLDERELYRTLSTRRPVAALLPGSRAARTLRDVAELILDDLEPTREPPEPPLAVTRPTGRQ